MPKEKSITLPLPAKEKGKSLVDSVLEQDAKNHPQPPTTTPAIFALQQAAGVITPDAIKREMPNVSTSKAEELAADIAQKLEDQRKKDEKSDLMKANDAMLASLQQTPEEQALEEMQDSVNIDDIFAHATPKSLLGFWKWETTGTFILKIDRMTDITGKFGTKPYLVAQIKADKADVVSRFVPMPSSLLTQMKKLTFPCVVSVTYSGTKEFLPPNAPKGTIPTKFKSFYVEQLN